MYFWQTETSDFHLHKAYITHKSKYNCNFNENKALFYLLQLIILARDRYVNFIKIL